MIILKKTNVFCDYDKSEYGIDHMWNNFSIEEREFWEQMCQNIFSEGSLQGLSPTLQKCRTVC